MIIVVPINILDVYYPPSLGLRWTQMVKNLLATRETWVQSLGREDPDPGIEGKGMATHSSILACRIPWTEEPEELQSIGSQRVRHD